MCNKLGNTTALKLIFKHHPKGKKFRICFLSRKINSQHLLCLSLTKIITQSKFPKDQHALLDQFVIREDLEFWQEARLAKQEAS